MTRLLISARPRVFTASTISDPEIAGQQTIHGERGLHALIEFTQLLSASKDCILQLILYKLDLHFWCIYWLGIQAGRDRNLEYPEQKMETSSSSSRSSTPPTIIRPHPTAPFHPHGDTATYRDLLLFEERLKMNAEMLRRRRRRYNSEFISSICSENDKLGKSAAMTE